MGVARYDMVIVSKPSMAGDDHSAGQARGGGARARRQRIRATGARGSEQAAAATATATATERWEVEGGRWEMEARS
jgi:hypothetical protein